MVPIAHVDDDLRFLVELELAAMENTQLGPHYDIAVPLMRSWMDVNVDAEAQRRKAQREHQSAGSADFVTEIPHGATEGGGALGAEDRKHTETDSAEDNEGTQ